MAYQGGIGGTFKNLWSPDLTTRAGAVSAMETASTVFFIIAGFRSITVLIWFGGGLLDATTSFGIVTGLLGVAEIMLMLVAAILLRKGRGLVVAVIGAFLYLLGLMISGNIISWVVGAVLLGALVGGIRGALALSRGTGFDDDVVDTFS